MNQPELTQQALGILRNGSTFQWYFIPLLAFVVYIYFNEISKKNWRGVAAGLSLYMVHWFYEIMNALIQHFSGHALWTVPEGTCYLLLIGVGWELSMMFSSGWPHLHEDTAGRPEDEDPGNQQQGCLRPGERGLFLRVRDLPRHDSCVSLGVLMVGFDSRFHHGIHPVLSRGKPGL